MDELFAVLGYKLKSSDMADVAEKLEQLEMALATTTEQDGASVLSTDTVHYNPSDLSGWVDTMLSDITTSCGCGFEIGNIPGESSSGNHNTTGSSRTDGERRRVTYDDDLSAIPGGAVSQSGANKRMRISAGFLENVSPPVTAARPFVVDSQETGVRLVHALTACGEAVQQGNMKLADALVQHVSVLAVSQGGAMGKVATYFAAALAQIIYGIGFSQLDPLQSDLLQMHFYETTPYLKFAHFTANQAILEAFAGSDRVHVVDFSLKEGMQWPALLQALALRPGGPPAFRLTGIGPTGPEYLEALQEVGWKLGQLAESMGVEFKFCGLGVNSLANLTENMLGIGPDSSETVAVNSVLELHPLLARPGAIEKVLGSIKAMDPKIVTVVEQEVNRNGDVFGRERFNEALHYFSTMFDSLESSGSTQPYNRDLTMTDVYLGRQICNVVASDGPERVERHETLG